MWNDMKQGDRYYLPLKKSLGSTMQNQWPALASSWKVHDDLEKRKNIVMNESEARALLLNGIANPMNLVIRVGRTDRSAVDMHRFRTFLARTPGFQVVLDTKTFPMTVAGKISNSADIMNMIPRAKDIYKLGKQNIAKKYGFASIAAFGGYEHAENFERFLAYAIHFENVMHREPVINDGMEDFCKQYKFFMTLKNLILNSATVDGRQVLRTLSTSNFRGMFIIITLCITGKCSKNLELFVSMYRDQEHRSSCSIGKKTCVVCFMQSLDAAGDSVDHKKHLLTNGENSATSYLACRDNLAVDAHARKLLLEITRKSGGEHTTYCAVTAARGCVWCLDELRSRTTDMQTFTKEEAVLVKQFEIDIEASVDTEKGSRGLVVRRCKDSNSSSNSTDNDPPNKKQKN